MMVVMPPDWDVIMRDEFPDAVRAVQRRLPRSMRSRFDAQDIVMDALVSLLESDRPLPETIGAGMIARIAGCRLMDRYRAGQAQKRRGERSWSKEADGTTTKAIDPAAFIEMNETFDAMADDLPVAGRELLRLIAEGWMTPEAALAIGWGVRRAQRFVAAIRARERI